ncbi:MAG TPA: ThiF family adenylyltransferase [Anaerolineales bacterium]
MGDPGFDYSTALARSLGLINAAEQQRLRKSTAAIAGMGGVGGAHLLAPTRLGLGGFHLADEGLRASPFP